MIRRLAFFIIIVLSVFTGGSPLLGNEILSIYYTASLNNNLIGCDCKTSPKAGLAKTAVGLRSRDRDSSILIDGGDLFSPEFEPAMADRVLESYLGLEYDVIAVGDQEFSNGLGELNQVVASTSTRMGQTGSSDSYPPFLCTNLRFISDEADTTDRDYPSMPVSTKPVVVTRSGIRVWIASFISSGVFYFYPKDITDSLHIEDPIRTARSLLKMRDAVSADLRIAVFHGSLSEAIEFADVTAGGMVRLYSYSESDEDVRSVRSNTVRVGMDILIVAHEQRLYEGMSPGGVPVFSPGEEGNRIGLLTLERDINDHRFIAHNEFEKFSYTADPDDPIVMELFDGYIESMLESIRKSREESDNR